MNTRCMNILPQRVISTIITIILVSTFVIPIPPAVFGSVIPNPISPYFGATTTSVNYPPLGIPTFVWEIVPEAIEYTLQVSQDIGFSTISLEITTSNTSFTPTSMDTLLFADGDWYWRVRVTTPSVSPYSPAMWFVKQWASVDNQPRLISPTPDAMLGSFNAPTFSWEHVVGASAYITQIATSSDGFNSPIYSQTTLTTSHQPSYKLANGQYYWRVIPLDSASHQGKESEMRRFWLLYGTSNLGQMPELYTPMENETVLFTPAFSWEAIPGAEKYLLEYMLDDGLCETGSGTIIETQLTTYTPKEAFKNANYCWHVKIISGLSEGEWTETKHFRKQWDLTPSLLTPTHNYDYANYPLFSWTPVPEASYYQIDIAINEQWANLFDQGITANPFYTPRKAYGTIPYNYTWRVTPFDWNGNPGVTSSIATFRNSYTSTAPSLISPLYYYHPNDPSLYGDEVVLNPYEDRTAQYPVFSWHRVDNPWPLGGTYAPAYRVQVSNSPFFSTILWTVDTESTHAAPSASNPFPNIDPGQNYYWRVCPLDASLESPTRECQTMLDSEDIWWSQTWIARFNPAIGIPLSDNNPPLLLRPTHGEEWVETPPLLEWQAIEGAAYYQVQVSRDPTFLNTADTVIDRNVPFPVYSSETSLAQRFLNRLNFGTFYWRVRANLSGEWGPWSEIQRFQIASQSEWRYDRELGSQENRLQIGTDEAGDALGSFDLTTLFSSSSKDKWYLGFDTILSLDLNQVFGLYVDIDHVDGSGALTPPPDRNYAVSTILAHQPEFAIYIDIVNGTTDEDNVLIYEYAANAWQIPKRLSDLQAPGEEGLYIVDGYLEISLPRSAIQTDENQGSISLMLFSADPAGSEIIKDSVPSNPILSGNVILSNFTSVSEHMNLYYPPNMVNSIDPTTHSSIGPFLWDFPAGGDLTGIDEDPPSPWSGSHLQICLDPACNTVIDERYQDSSPYYFASHHETFEDDLRGDATYYWRIQPRYLHLEQEYFGVYNNSNTFTHQGFVPENLTTSYSFMTPTFTWDMVEGAGAYDLQVSKSPEFTTSDLIIDENNLTQNRYTPITSLAEAEYWWRVRIRRYGNIPGSWSTPANFALNGPSPTALTPDDPDGNQAVESAPTLCWEPLVAYFDGKPVLSAWRYKVEISKNVDFYTIYDSVITEQTCWTPTRGVDDGHYYWRVAMVDGNSYIGNFSEIAQFTKQYPSPTLLSPTGSVAETPTFHWTPVPGARSYFLHISQSPTFTPIYENIETVNTQYTPRQKYDLNKTYYWRVAMLDNDGIIGPFSNAIVIVGKSISRLPLVFK